MGTSAQLLLALAMLRAAIATTTHPTPGDGPHLTARARELGHRRLTEAAVVTTTDSVPMDAWMDAVPEPDVAVFYHGLSTEFPCFRVPSLIAVPGVLLAFAECRRFVGVRDFGARFPPFTI